MDEKLHWYYLAVSALVIFSILGIFFVCVGKPQVCIYSAPLKLKPVGGNGENIKSEGKF